MGEENETQSVETAPQGQPTVEPVESVGNEVQPEAPVQPPVPEPDPQPEPSPNVLDRVLGRNQENAEPTAANAPKPSAKEVMMSKRDERLRRMREGLCVNCAAQLTDKGVCENCGYQRS